MSTSLKIKIRVVLVAGTTPQSPNRVEAMTLPRWPYPLTSSAAREREGGGSELQLSRHHRKFASQLNGRHGLETTYTHWRTDS